MPLPRGGLRVAVVLHGAVLALVVSAWLRGGGLDIFGGLRRRTNARGDHRDPVACSGWPPIPPHLSPEAKQLLTELQLGAQPPTPWPPAGTPASAAFAALARARFRERSSAVSAKHRDVLVASWAPITLGGVPAVESTPKPGTMLGHGGRGAWASAADASALIIHFHGGAYLVGAPQDMFHAFAPLSAATGIKAVSVDYRLAPEHPFPAALDDAVAAYRAALESHDATRVAVAGESAGAGLAAALLLRAAAEGLPLPAAAVLVAPWAVLNVGGADTHSTLRCAEPILTFDILRHAAEAYAPGGNVTHPLASPALGDYSAAAAAAAVAAGRGFPPVLIQAGTRDMLLGDSALLARRMRQGGVDARLSVYDGMWHVWQAGISGALGVPEALEAIEEAAGFVRAHVPS